MCTNNHEKYRFHYRLRWWWIILLLLLLFFILRWDWNIYSETELISQTCVYQDITTHPRSGISVSYGIMDDNQNEYYLGLNNVKTLSDALSPGDTLVMKIEPHNPRCLSYNRMIAYLESNGVVYYSLDDYRAYKLSLIHQNKILIPIWIILLLFLLVLSFCNQNSEYFIDKFLQHRKKD